MEISEVLRLRNVRLLLRQKNEFGLPLMVEVVDLQMHLGVRVVRWVKTFSQPVTVADRIVPGTDSMAS